VPIYPIVVTLDTSESENEAERQFSSLPPKAGQVEQKEEAVEKLSELPKENQKAESKAQKEEQKEQQQQPQSRRGSSFQAGSLEKPRKRRPSLPDK